MGCWNQTCGLSSLHIRADDPVYVFLLEHMTDPGVTYSTGLFRPLLLPFEARYNDYGAGRGSSGKVFDTVMAAVRENLVELPQGANHYRDTPVSRENLGEEEFYKAIQNERLYLKPQGPWPQRRLLFTMFRKDVVDHILENRDLVDFVGYNQGSCGFNNAYIRYRFKDVVTQVRPYIDGLIERSRRMNLPPDLAFLLVDSRTMGSPISNYLRDSDSRFSRLVDVKDWLFKAPQMTTEQELTDLEAVLTAYLRGQFVERFMLAARKTWVPGGHEGSQDESGDALHQLYSATLAALERERTEYDEEESD